MNNIILDDVEYITKLYYDLFNIPFIIVDQQGKLLSQFAKEIFESPSRVLLKQKLSEAPKEPVQPCIPLFFQSSCLENYFSIRLQSNELNIGFLIAGPILYKKLSDETIYAIRNDYCPKTSKKVFVHYFHSLPVIREIDFINMSCALFYMIYRKKLNAAEIGERHFLEENQEGKIEEPFAQLAEKRLNEEASINTINEKMLFSLIKSGKKYQLLQTLNTQTDAELGLLSKSSFLRSLKNNGIAAITLATRAAVEGGLNKMTAYHLSDSVIQQLEDLSDPVTVGDFIQKSLYKFAELVDNKKNHQYSKPVNICQSHINANLYNSISLSELAELTGMNASYLSFLFKKEVGMSISSFIHHEKIEEAKNLLLFTDRSLSEISTILNFHDQSHFTKVFKKITGVTPKQFHS